VIDVASKKVTQTIDLGTAIESHSPDARRQVRPRLDLEAGAVIVLDTATRKEVKRLPLGKMPEGILIPPAGGLLRRRQRRQPCRRRRSEDVAGREQDLHGNGT
jgi:YVTN family beta-propeller protein